MVPSHRVRSRGDLRDEVAPMSLQQEQRDHIPLAHLLGMVEVLTSYAPHLFNHEVS